MTSFAQLQQHFVHHLNGSGGSSSPITIPSFSESKIVLSREKKYWSYGPGDKIEGRLILRNQEDVYCCGIRVDLEVIVSVKFREKDWKMFHSTVEDILQPKVFTYVWPVNWSWVQISGKLTNEKLLCLPASKHVFPFRFQYPSKVVLPGSFSSPYGVVRHQVVAYFQTPWDFVQISSTTLKFRDYYNLALDPVALSPLTYEKQKRSLFHDLVRRSFSQRLAFTLRLPRQGYLPGDDSHFLLTLINQTGKRIERILVSLIQKVCYHTDKNKKKTMGTVLDCTETTEADWAVETLWESSFRVPLGVKPTYRGIIEHTYFIKVQVYLKGSRRAVLKGHVPVIIGTTDNVHDNGHGSSSRELSEHELYTGHYSASRRRRSVDLPFHGDQDGKYRSKSPHRAPPPSYSQLPSRASSVDTFPPMYEDAMVNSESATTVAPPSTSASSSGSNLNPKPSTSQSSSS
ncbi:unnamed protein product [Orchesella dallaii]|uniref:Arrestin C-terminal-like domain-containing protein n=1 Tax=Orchesella dallaii TaxID=48710 RepID=A0ABP1PT44_9HEXA